MGPKSFTSSINGVDQDALSRYRPGLPKQLSRAIYEYHTDRGSGWFRAWDVVTGDGSIAIELSRYFNAVWSTSISLSVTSSAMSTLASVIPTSPMHASNLAKIAFLVRDPAHGLAGQAPGTLDTAAIANAMHLVEAPDKVLAAGADMLKAGGTLAAWAVSVRFFFMDAPSQAQGIFDAALAKWAAARGQGKGKAAAAKQMKMLESRLDDLAFPTRQWIAVKRVHWNPSEPMVLASNHRHPVHCTTTTSTTAKDSSENITQHDPTAGYPSPLPSPPLPHPSDNLTLSPMTSTDEIVEVEEIANPGFSSARVDLDWMVNYLQSHDTDVVVEEVCGEEFSKLERVLEGRGKKWRVGWGVSLVLGTRR